MKCLQYLNVRYTALPHMVRVRICVPFDELITNYISLHVLCTPGSFSLRGNCIIEESALQSLRHVSKSLRCLVIADNPLVDTTDYRMSVLILLPQLERLDKENVSSDEKAEAEERIMVKLKTPPMYTCDQSEKNTYVSNCMYVISGT